MVGLTFCITMLPSARVTRGGTSHLHAAAAVLRVTSGMRRRRHARVAVHKRDTLATSRKGHGGGVRFTGQPSAVARRRSAARPRQVQRFAQPSAVAVNVVRGRQSAWAAGAVPGAVRASTRELLRRSRCRRSRAPPQECIGRCQPLADDDPRGTECQRIYACASACQYECTQSNMKIH
jgi:hypothetical protein